ncbi:MAG: beta-lactamase family protein [Myxococcales bacterium]|nr:beta-lactamase family protein [Myxococcales bacterium]
MSAAPVRRLDFALKGEVAPGFDAVRAVLDESFQSGEEWGAALCVSQAGRVVVDLWGGARDRERQIPWQPDTLSTGFSSTKGLVALCFLMLADRGRLDYDAPVASYWPEFAQRGKAEISVRCLLNHRAGLIGVSTPITLELIENQPERVSEILAEQVPSWIPDTNQGYHGVTYGLYAQELFKRVQGESLGSFMRREIAEPLGADVYLGLPEDLESRVARNYAATTRERVFHIVPQLLLSTNEGRVFRQVVSGGDAARAFAHPAELGPRGIDNFNSRRVHALELPWANALLSARGLCRVYTALALGGAVDGVRLVKAETIGPVLERQSWSAQDRVLRKPLGWSQGFLKEELGMFSPNQTSFGHPGAGGSMGWCDPENQLAIAYVTNKMAYHIRSPRARRLSHTIYECLQGGARS